MEMATIRCMLRFNSKHQSENVVLGMEETMVAKSRDILVVPSFTCS